MFIKVNEIFGPTIQGEGKTSGEEVMFLRLSGCNLHCIWCDTPYTWNWEGTTFLHPLKFDRRKEVIELGEEDILSRLESLNEGRVKRLVVSGGEPLIQQKALGSLFGKLKSFGWTIEVETNGTIAPDDNVSALVDQFNCSPKLSNSDNPEHLRIRAGVLTKLALNPKFTFKFVVSCCKDIDEILKFVEVFALKNVYLMPLGMTPAELQQTRQLTKGLCEQHGFTFSDRLHVILFGGKRAV